MEGGDSAPASDIFCAKRSIPPPFAPRAQRLMRLAKGRAGDLEAGSAPRGRIAAERPQGVPRLPGAIAHVPGAGHLRTWFQQFYQNRGGILVLAGTNVRRRRHGAMAGIVAPVLGFFGCVRGSSLLFSKERPAVGAWNSSIFGRPAFLSKTFHAIAKKDNAKAKKWRDDLHGKS